MTPETDAVPKKRVHPIVHWFDVLFIMALCFVTLLTTMLLRGKVLVGEGEATTLDYSFGLGSCILVVLVFVAYLRYMLVHSERELREMVNHVYGEKPDAEPSAVAPTAGGDCATSSVVEPTEPVKGSE